MIFAAWSIDRCMSSGASRWSDNAPAESEGWKVFVKFYQTKCSELDSLKQLLEKGVAAWEKDASRVRTIGFESDPDWAAMKAAVMKTKITVSELEMMKTYTDMKSSNTQKYQLTKDMIGMHRVQGIDAQTFHPLLRKMMKNALKMHGPPP